MTIVAWALFAAALVANILAIRALFARDHFAKWKRRCLGSATVVALAAALTTVASFYLDAPQSTTTGADRARRLGYAVALTMNGAAFAIVATAIPFVAAIILHRRAARSPSASGSTSL